MYLAAHPLIRMSREKEPAFFDKDHLFSTDGIARQDAWDRYLSQFEGKSDEIRWIGEATPSMVFPEVPRRVLANCGANVKIILSLRDPVARAYSHYWHAYALGVESRSVEEALFGDENEPIQDTGRFPKYFLLNGRYHMHLERFAATFGKQNVLLVKFESLTKDPASALVPVWRFLGINPIRIDSAIRANPSRMPSHIGVQRFLANPSTAKTVLKHLLPPKLRRHLTAYVEGWNLRPTAYDKIPPTLRLKLAKYYASDNLKLREDWGFDISGWTGPEGQEFPP